MPRRSWSASTRLFSSADDSSDSSDTSSGGWDRTARATAAGRGSPPSRDVSPSKLALPALAAALRASRARASAAQAKASRLLEETERLRAALKTARRGEERADRCESDLAQSKARARELESDNGRLRRDLDGARLRTRQTEAKARRSLSALRSTLEELEQSQRERSKRWRATTRSQRALLESLRRHVQRGHHATPSFTAFQLIEQIFECLKTLESDAGLLPLTSPRGTPRRRPAPAGRSSTPSSPLGFPQSASPPKTKPASSADTRRTSPRSRPPTGSGAPTTQGLPPPPPPSRWSDRDDNSRFDADSLGRGGGVEDSPAGGGGSFVFPSGGSSSDGSQEKFHPRGGGEGGRDRKGTTAKFSTEWAYRLAVTKLTAQLRAARERLRGEKEASREAGERVEQEELRCRQLELEVDGLSSKLAAADGHRRRLEAMLKEAKRERDVLKRKHHSTAATHALTAALDVLHQRGRPATPQTYVRAPSPPAAAFHPTAAAAPHVSPAPPTTVPAAAVSAATAGEALNCGRGKGLDPRALTPEYSGGGSGGGGVYNGQGVDGDVRFSQGGGSAWWDGDEDQRHRYSRPTTGEHTPASPAPFAAPGAPSYADRRQTPEPRSPPGIDAAAATYGSGDPGNAANIKRDARSEIQRIVDDAVRNGARAHIGETGVGGPGVTSGDSTTDVLGASKPWRLEGDGGGYRWRDPGPRYGGSILRDSDRDTRAAAPGPPPPPQQPPISAALTGAFGGDRWLSSRTSNIGRATPSGFAAAAGGAAAAVGGGGGGGSTKIGRAPLKGTHGGVSGGGGGKKDPPAPRSASRFGGGAGSGMSFSGQLGPRAVTREDLTRLDDEIANLSKTVEEAAMAQTRQRLRNVC